VPDPTDVCPVAVLTEIVAMVNNTDEAQRRASIASSK